MRYLPLLAAALCFAAPAKADKFWLSDPKAEATAPAGSTPNMIQGVLVAEDDTSYHIRIVGGEILLPKASVFKIEKDGLTVQGIVDAEKAAAEGGELANDERRRAQKLDREHRRVRLADASAKKAKAAKVVEASLRRPITTTAAGFDPVLGVSLRTNEHFDRMREAKAAWELTRNRAYMKLLRQLRRMR